MAFMYIFDPVNIILCDMNIKIFPYFPKSLHIGFISSIEPILILNLEHNDTALRVGLCSQVRPHDGHQGLEVDAGLVQEYWVVGPALDTRHIEQSGRQSSEIPLRADIGPWPEEHKHFMFLGQLEEEWEILVASFVVKNSLRYLVVVPHDVHAQGVQA